MTCQINGFRAKTFDLGTKRAVSIASRNDRLKAFFHQYPGNLSE
jgi:hypothetical protein